MDSFDEDLILGDSFEEDFIVTDKCSTKNVVECVSDNSHESTFDGEVHFLTKEDEDEIKTIVHNILHIIHTNECFTEGNVTDISNLLHKHVSILDRNIAAACIHEYLTAMAQVVPCSGSQKVLEFVAIAATFHSQAGSRILWDVIQLHVDQCSFCTEDDVRAHACRVIEMCLQHSIGEEDEFGIEDDLVERWAKILTQRRVDKAVNVRMAAVMAIAQLPHRELVNFRERKFYPNNEVGMSLRDADASVRGVAIRAVAFLSSDDVQQCLGCLRREPTDELRRLMAAKLIQQVHPLSCSENQRAAFVNVLWSSDDVTRKMLSCRLVPRWFADCDLSVSSLTAFMDPLSHEEASRRLICAFFSDRLRRYDTAIAFVEHLDGVNPLLTATSLLSVFSKSADELMRCLFVHSCLLESCVRACGDDPVVVQLVSDHLVPPAPKLVSVLMSLAPEWLGQDKERVVEEKALSMAMALVGRGGDEATTRRLLEYLCMSPKLRPSELFIREVVRELFAVCEDEDNLVEWFCYELNGLLSEGDEFRWRCLLVLHEVMRRGTHVTVLLKTLFNSLVDWCFTSLDESHRSVGVSVIGLFCMGDIGCLEAHVDKIRHSVHLDLPTVKCHSIPALADVICTYGVEETAYWAFAEYPLDGEDSRENKLRELFEEVVIHQDSSVVSRGVEGALHVFALCSPSWPTLLGQIIAASNSHRRDTNTLYVKRIVRNFFENTTDEMRMQLIHSVHSVLMNLDRDDPPFLIPPFIGKVFEYSRSFTTEGRSAHWVLVSMLIGYCIDNPESEYNKSLIGCIQNIRLDGIWRFDWLIKKVRIAEERMAIYDQNRVGTMLRNFAKKLELTRDGKTRKRTNKEGTTQQVKRKMQLLEDS